MLMICDFSPQTGDRRPADFHDGCFILCGHSRDSTCKWDCRYTGTPGLKMDPLYVPFVRGVVV